MDAFETRFEREVVAALVEIEESRVEGVASGQPVSYDEYRHRTGYIAGLRAAKAIVEDVRKKLSQGDGGFRD
jgi:hypothetical protein